MLPHPWIVIPDRPIDLAECTIIHQVYGIGLINPVRADITDAFLAWLMRERFGEYFPGTIPVLVIAIDSDDIDKISQFLSDTFLECVVTVENEGWADGMSELLLRQRNPLPPETCKPVDLSDLYQVPEELTHIGACGEDAGVIQHGDQRDEDRHGSACSASRGL
jgi:hypothetical protein